MDRAALALLLILAAGTGGAVLYLRSRQQAGEGGITAPELSATGLAPGSLDFGLGLGDPLAAVTAFAQSTAELVGLSQPRGIRNRNPGNVKRGPDSWRGLSPTAEQTDPVFWRFIAPEYGIRVIAYLLLGYQSKKGKRSIRQLISETGGWAPTGSADKNPAEYSDYVARAAGVGVDQALNLASDPETLRRIVVAIIAFENGGYSYPAGVVDAGLAMARS